MFRVGEAVYHPNNGAGIIANLQDMPAMDEPQQCYKIRILGKTKTMVMVPVQKAEEIGLRRAVAKSDVKEVLDILSSEPTNLPKQHKRRYKVCNDKLDTGDTEKIAEVLRDLTWRRIQEEKLNVPGRRIFNRGMKLLTGELAVSQGITLQSAEEQIHTALQAQYERAEVE